jgi:hypothetical protein
MNIIILIIIIPFNPTKALRVDSACNGNEYEECLLEDKGGQCVRLTSLLPSCAECLKIWEFQPPGTLRDSHSLSGPLQA